MQAMPEFARNIVHGRLETILDDVETKHGVTGATAIELVLDGATSAGAMATVTH